MKQTIFSLIAALLFLNGCKVIEYVEVPVVVTVTKDSIVEKIITDTLLIYPKQENKVIAVDSSYLKTDLAFSFAKITPEGGLYHSIQNFGFIPSKVEKTTTKVKEEKPKIIKETKTVIKEVKVEVNKLSYWDYSSFAIHFLLFAFVVWKIKRKLAP